MMLHTQTHTLIHKHTPQTHKHTNEMFILALNTIKKVRGAARAVRDNAALNQLQVLRVDTFPNGFLRQIPKMKEEGKTR